VVAAELFRARPVIQAPMAAAGGVALAVAAILGGGIGSLPCALVTPAQAKEQAGAVRAEADGPLNLNFFCHTLDAPDDEAEWHALLAPYYAEYAVGPPAEPPPPRLPFDAAMCAVVEAVRPEIVSFHFGLPDSDLLARVKATGALILSSATSVAEARWLAARGVDAVIAQGFEAGGHTALFPALGTGHRDAAVRDIAAAEDAIDLPVDRRRRDCRCARTSRPRFGHWAHVRYRSAPPISRLPESLASAAHRALLAQRGCGGDAASPT
jgi:nitronate monooxygenase